MALPALQISTDPTGNIPQVASVRPQISEAFNSLSRGIGAAADGVSDVGRTVVSERQADYHVNEMVARREADDLHRDYAVTFNGLAHGAADPDGNATEGWDALKYDSLDSPDGGASKRLSKAQQEWLQSGKYSALSPRAKALFDARAQATYAALAEEAVKIDARNGFERRKTHDQANVAASLSIADSVPLDNDGTWRLALDKSAADVAVMKMGTEILNPEDLYSGGPTPDATRLRFRGGEAMRAVFDADVKKTQDDLRADRAARMIDAARAETDLDKQEQFLTLAQGFAKEHVTDEKTLAAVTTSAESIRADALKKEAYTALDALATGKPYVYEGNARRETAYKYAAQKVDNNRKKQAARDASQLSRAMRSNSAFLAASLEAGVWVDPEGNLQPLDMPQRRQTALDALDKGVIDIPHYAAIQSKLDAVEKSGRQADYEQISADVASALAPDVETVFKDGRVSLSDKEKDPARVVARYTVEEKGMKTEPVTRALPSYMGIPVTVPTGETRNVEVTTHSKKELMAKDIPQIISLLMDAKRTQGMPVWRDLNGNTVKKPTKSSFNDYKEFLLNDFSDRQTALDIDAKSAKARDAIAAVRYNFAADEARVLRSAAARPVLPSASEDTTSDTQDDSLWP